MEEEGGNLRRLKGGDQNQPPLPAEGAEGSLLVAGGVRAGANASGDEGGQAAQPAPTPVEMKGGRPRSLHQRQGR